MKIQLAIFTLIFLVGWTIGQGQDIEAEQTAPRIRPKLSEQDPCDDRVGFDEPCENSRQCQVGLSCQNGQCDCRRDTYRQWQNWGPKIGFACVMLPIFDQPCQTECRRPFVCDETVHRCACPQGSKMHLRYGFCYRDCASDEEFDEHTATCYKKCRSSEVMINKRCFQIAPLGSSCEFSSQCVQPFSFCDSGVCRCTQGFKEEANGQCVATELNCIFGEPLRDSLGAIVNCSRRLPKINAGHVQILEETKYVADSCPDGAYCYASPAAAGGHCCPIGNTKHCPYGKPHPNATCDMTTIELSENPSCPRSTHFCHMLGLPGAKARSICCPRPCDNLHVYKFGRCLPRVKFGSLCETDEQCEGLSYCINGMCKCSDSAVATKTPFGYECKIACNVKQVQIDGECVPRLKIGDSCLDNRFCPHGAHCSYLSRRCVCNCNLIQLSEYFCAPEAHCPSMIFNVPPMAEMGSEPKPRPELCRAGWREQRNAFEGVFQNLRDHCDEDQFCIHYIGDPQFELGVCCPKPKPRCPSGLLLAAPVPCSPHEPSSCGPQGICFRYYSPADRESTDGFTCCPGFARLRRRRKRAFN